MFTSIRRAYNRATRHARDAEMLRRDPRVRAEVEAIARRHDMPLPQFTIR